MKKRYIALAAAAALCLLSGCGRTEYYHGYLTGTSSMPAESGSSRPNYSIPLTTAPEIALTDALSSKQSEFIVQSGNFSWSYQKNDKLESIIACGTHPLDQNQQKGNKLKIPEYQGTDAVFYVISWIVTPDKLIVREWDISKLGDTEAAPDAENTYEDATMAELKPGKVYELTAVWDEEKLDQNQFYGEASYTLLTEQG